jgi:hypothetical protein
LIGVEPGKVEGAPSLDPADIDNWLSEYLGQDGPQWSADYIDMGMARVLVFTVEAPRWGDQIQTLRKGYEKAPAGRIFTRRAGKTIEANPSEIRMLEKRSQQNAERIAVDLLGEAEDGTLRPYLAEQSDYFSWRDNEQARLESAISQYHAASRDSNLFARAHMEREIRTSEMYNEEVQTYLRNARLRWQALIWEGGIVLRLAVLKLAIRNLSDRNFSGVEITVTTPSEIKPFCDPGEPSERLGAPSPPALYGYRTAASQIANRLRGKPERVFVGPFVELSNNGNRVIFSPEDVRPRQDHRLPEIFLAIPQSLVDEKVELEWRATSTSADGDAGGTLDFAVDSNPVRAPFLVAAAEDASR